MALLEPLAEMYRIQFRWEDGRLIFRRGGTGVGYAVSEVEMVEVVETYRRRALLIITGAMVLCASAIVMTIWLAPSDQLVYWLVGAVLLAGVGTVLPHRWAYHSPTNRIVVRMPVASHRSGLEVQKEGLSQFGWTEALVVLAACAAALFKMDHFPPLGTDWLMFIPLACALPFLLWVAWMKLRLEA